MSTHAGRANGLGPGVIVLAAYRPDPALLARQLGSIRAQTVSDFTCLITADGDWEQVRDVVTSITEADERFTVLGYDQRLGFYRNFERGLRAVPATAGWVALSDQDDYWYADKLERLLPHLADVALVSGQARVVQHPSGNVVAETTNRHDAPIESYMLDNQYTGGQLVFRRALLDIAIPFPGLRTPAEVHDHWLAVLAHFAGGARVLPDIVQDYVQHDANVIGEAQRGFSPRRSVANARRIAEKYEGDGSLRSIALATYRVGVGWRETLAIAIDERVAEGTPDRERIIALYGPRRRFWKTSASIWRSVRSGYASLRSGVEYVAGWVLGVIFGARR